MRAEFRRCAVYALIGAVLLPVTRWALRDFLPPKPGEPWPVLVLCSVLSIAAIAILRWRLRIDSTGIARRRLFAWDVWPWQAFEQGKVLDVEGTSTTYILPEKPFWARKLTLDLLDDSDRVCVEAPILALRRRPTLELPNELAVRLGFRKEVLIAPGGLLVNEAGEETRFRWAEVHALRISRFDRRRRDFKSLDVLLPDRTLTFSVRLHDGQAIRSWSAARGGETPSAEILAALLERFISRERVQVDSLNEAPLTLEQWHARRAEMDKRTREHRNHRRILWVAAFLLVMISLSGYRRGPFAVLGMIGLSAVAIGMFFLLARYLEAGHRENLAKLEAQMPEQ